MSWFQRRLYIAGTFIEVIVKRNPAEMRSGVKIHACDCTDSPQWIIQFEMWHRYFRRATNFGFWQLTDRCQVHRWWMRTWHHQSSYTTACLWSILSDAAMNATETCPGELRRRRIAVIILNKCHEKPDCAELRIFSRKILYPNENFTSMIRYRDVD